MARPADLVGRNAELGELAAMAERVHLGGAQLLVIEGAAGSGKSALADAFVDVVGARGFCVRRAGADELGGRQSFGLIAGLFGGEWRGGEREGCEPGGERLELSAWQPRRARTEGLICEAAVEAIELLCQVGPVALVLEDLHWSDPASLGVLRHVFRRIASLPVAVLGTMRPSPLAPELAALVGDLGVPGRKVLGPLDDASVHELVRARLGAAPGPRLAAQLSLAAGNPLFVLELLETLGLEGALHYLDGSEDGATTLEVDHTQIPPSLVLTIVRHLSFLPAETLRVLGVAAVLGVAFRPAHLGALLGRPVSDLVEPLGRAQAAGLLREDGEDLSFAHDLLREALYLDLPRGVRSGLHRDAASALARMGAPAGRVAEHLLRGAEPGDDAAAHLLHGVARHLAAEAPGEAVDLLSRALEILPPISPMVPSLSADLAVALVWSGRSLDGEDACRRALVMLADRRRRAMLRQCLVESLLARAECDAVLAEAASGADDVRDDRVAKARLDALSANALLFVGRLDEAAELSAEAEQAGLAGGDREVTVQALVVRALVAELRGQAGVAVEVAGRAVAIAEADGTRQTHRRLAHLVWAMALVDLDDFERARSALERAVEVHESFGALDAVALLHIGLGFTHFWSGAWDEAEVELDTGLELAEETAAGWRAAARGLRAVVALGRGDVPLVERCLRLAEDELAAGGAEYRVEWLAWARALALEAAGDTAGAAKHLEPTLASWASGRASPSIAAVAPSALRLAIDTGLTDLAAEVVAKLERLAEANPGRRGIAAAAAASRAQLEGDADALAAAAMAYVRAGRPLQAAMATEQAALALGAAGRNEEARRELAEAVAGYERLGATAFVARATRRADIAPALDAVAKTPRARFGWDALTPAEMQVLRLVAERRSNPEIAAMLGVSRRTVETHVSHVLAKVSLRSRVTLAAEAAQHFGWRLRLEQLGQ